ncbi:MAG: response regulator transcription factor [Verrucomicrobiota bacterium]
MPSVPSIRVIVVDDHFMSRIGLKVPINQQEDMQVVDEGRNAREAIATYREHRPDVMTLDYRLPDSEGPEAARTIRSEFPGARILVISAAEAEEQIYRAAKAGVCGYLNKSADCGVILDAIRRVHAGETVFSGPIAEKLARRRARADLGERELEILGLIVRGFSNKEIAAELRYSTSTIKQELSRLLEKLGVADRTRAATIAIERGIVDLEE